MKNLERAREFCRRTFVVAPLLALLLALCPAFAKAADSGPALATISRISSIQLGIGGVSKIGRWTPLVVTISNADGADGIRVEATTLDIDGTPVKTFSSDGASMKSVAGDLKRGTVFIKPGRPHAGIAIRAIAESDATITSRTFYPADIATEDAFRTPSNATTRIVAVCGTDDLLTDVFPRSRGGASESSTSIRAARVDKLTDLPSAWQGYDAVDTVVVLGTQLKAFEGLTIDSPQITALTKWVELGGRLVLFSGANAERLIGAKAPFYDLAPGRLEDIVPLRQSIALETFAGSNAIIGTGQIELRVPKLSNVRGRALAFRGQDPADLPLVIRTRRGLGEVTFVAVDPDVAPLASWPGRAGFVRQALGWPASGVSGSTGEGRIITGDISSQLRVALDSQLPGVAVASFGLATLMVIAYLALIGPAEYYFATKLLRRPGVTWFTFPAIVVGASLAAAAIAGRMKGDELRINQLEIVDVDNHTGTERGTVVSHFFSPRVRRFDLSLKPWAPPEDSGPGGRQTGGDRPRSIVGWYGAPSFSLGAGNGNSAADNVDDGYEISDELSRIRRLPIEQWSTKTLAAAWTRETPNKIGGRLRLLPDDLISGRIINSSGIELEDCVLLHGPWAYRLPDLHKDAEVSIDDAIQPQTVRQALSSSSAGHASSGGSHNDSAPPYDPYGIDIPRIAKTMMFYEAVGGAGFTSTSNEYLRLLDMSRLLDGDQAVLLASAPEGDSSAWVDDERSQDLDAARRNWVYYRFVLPVERPVEATVPAR
jgi:hypothetical protein